MKIKQYFILIISLILFCSCTPDIPQNDEVIVCKSQYTCDEGNVICKNNEYTFKDYKKAELTFTCNNINPNDIYCASVCVRTNVGNISLCGSESDINSNRVVKELSQGSDDWTIISRVIKTDNKGNADFRLIMNGYKDNANIQTVVAWSVIEHLEISNKYNVYFSKDKSIKMVLIKQDVVDNNISDKTIVEWLNVISELKDNLEYISGNKKGEISIIGTENFDHYGLSGNPIYISRKAIQENLSKISLKEDKQNCFIMWPIIHEIAHFYDGAGDNKMSDWIFDTEFSAQLECMTALDKSGYNCDGKSIYDYLNDKNSLDKGVYSDEGFVFVLYEMLGTKGDLSKCIHDIITSDELKNGNNKDKFRKFKSLVEQKSGKKLSDVLSKKAFDAIEYNFDA